MGMVDSKAVIPFGLPSGIVTCARLQTMAMAGVVAVPPAAVGEPVVTVSIAKGSGAVEALSCHMILQ